MGILITIKKDQLMFSTNPRPKISNIKGLKAQIPQQARIQSIT